MLCHWHHWNGIICGEPVRSIIPAGIVAYVIEITEKERHCIKFVNTGSSMTLNLITVLIGNY